MRVSNNSELLKIPYRGNGLRLGWELLLTLSLTQEYRYWLQLSSGGRPCILELRVPYQGITERHHTPVFMAKYLSVILNSSFFHNLCSTQQVLSTPQHIWHLSTSLHSNYYLLCSSQTLNLV